MSDQIKEKGGISVETEHIFPVIKKWLYSEKEIFLREIVSNACDAITKHRRLVSLGQIESEGEEYKITVKVDKEEKTLTVSDNGIGMNGEEVRKYICQMALSGALDFINKYEGEGASNGIIGHFGLGFYSSFMVSDTVDLITKSFDGSKSVKWVCTDAGDYEIYDGNREERGTDVVMHIADGEEEYLEQGKIRSILERYCAFMPVEIYLDIVGKEDEHHHDGCDCDDCKEEKDSTPKPINDTAPLWLKQPSECTEEEYKTFYSKVFADYREPLFHIHINAEYPLNFKGILYFPRLNAEYDSFEGQVKLYYNQVFVADNIKEVIPEYMLMLKGVLDCPELPLNVSRSYLQNNGYVSKISSHIVKKICDKLNGLFNTDREGYEKMWQDIKIFVEYSAMRDRKFYDRVKNSILLPLSDGSYKTVDEYLEGAKETNEGIVYYSTDKLTQAQYIAMLKKQGINVVIFDKLIETQLINLLESDKNIKFMRVDSSIADSLKGDGKEFKNDSLAELFKKVSGDETLEVKFESLKDEKVPALLTVSEQSRRFEDMMKMYRMSGGEDDGSYKAPIESTLILNSSSALIRKMAESKSSDELESAAKQIYRLALLSHRQLTADELESFLYDSFDMLEKNF